MGGAPGPDCVLFRDGNDIGPEGGVNRTVGVNSYADKLPPPRFIPCDNDIWAPHADIAEEEVAQVDPMAAERRKRARKAAAKWLKARINAVRITAASDAKLGLAAR